MNALKHDTRQDDRPASMPVSARKLVLLYRGAQAQAQKQAPRGHEFDTHAALASRLASIMGYDFGGEFDSKSTYDAPLYFVPSDTLVPLESAHRLGIRGEHHLFGGVVPYPFVATKCITHALPEAHAAAPQGWSPHFGEQVRHVVLPGYSAFTPEDARIAARRLLTHGRVRLKKPSGIGGLGQCVISSLDELEAELRECGAAGVASEGLVLERNLNDVNTHSVGQIRVGNLVASYCGVQGLTTNNRGAQVYGGSRLFIVRGGFEELLRRNLDEKTLIAVSQARTYHAAALAAFPGMFASRCNYDVAQGIDDEGQWRSGVLEQSWRIGGASGAELTALKAFANDPSIHSVQASTTEAYGDGVLIPGDADVYYHGEDPRAGRIIKYARMESYAHT